MPVDCINASLLYCTGLYFVGFKFCKSVKIGCDAHDFFEAQNLLPANYSPSAVVCYIGEMFALIHAFKS